MNSSEGLPPRLRDLIDDYLSGLALEAQVAELEALLRADGEVRRHFVRYCRMHTDLYLAVRASRAGQRALARLEHASEGAPGAAAAVFRLLASFLPARNVPWTLRKACGGLVALVVVGALAVAGVRGLSRPGARDAAVAWLLNAQDCQWAESLPPAGDMRPGTTLRIERGLAEVGFKSGARVVLEGPASLELISGTLTRLLRGKATASVPESAKGFTILSPQGRVVDLGTELAISVADDGTTEVFVFKGQVEAVSSRSTGPGAAGITLGERQAALLDGAGVSPRTESQTAELSRLVRTIIPPLKIVPRALNLDFRRAGYGTVLDADGLGAGLTHRLPGTGGDLPDRDPNLRLNREKGQLELTTTNSDINTQFQLRRGEYLGVRLSDLGFTGVEDFAVTAFIPNIPKLEFIGQFGLYAGARSDKNIRGGLLSLRAADSYELFLVNNDGGRDSDLYELGLFTTGDDLRLTLRREEGRYSLTVENETTGSSSTLAIRHPSFLDGERDLFVGIFGANTQSEVRKVLVIKDLEVTVWTASP